MMWPFKKRLVKTKIVSVPLRGRRANARFDAAQDTPDNRNHWANADSLGPATALIPSVRRDLRNRSRYEVFNNSYARGIVETLANDVIGTGPRLQMLGPDHDANRIIEVAFASWARMVCLAEKLRTMRVARAQDGEAFGIIIRNDRLKHAVKFDLRLVEADMVASPDPWQADLADGIRYDEAGNPESYHILDTHPGDLDMFASTSGRWTDAGSILHWYRVDRPGQKRGVPDIMPALPLFAQLRRYTLAVIGAAEAAAEMAIVLQTTLPTTTGAPDGIEAATEMEWARQQMTFLPEGWGASQIKAEQPPQAYDIFKREILNEIARCLNMPYNVAACNSSSYNYASGRLDHQTYFRAIAIEQSEAERIILDPILSAFLTAVRYRLGMKADSALHQWFWSGREHVDPAKEATAQETRLKNHMTTFAAEYARGGLDWEEELNQRARELKLMRQLGLPEPSAKPTGAPGDNGGKPRESGGGNGNDEARFVPEAVARRGRCDV